MRFSVLFALVFFGMLAAVLVQARRQCRLSRRSFGLALAAGLGLSLLLFAMRLLSESWPLFLARPLWWFGYGLFGLVAYLFLFQLMVFAGEIGARLAAPDKTPRLRSRRAFLLASGGALATVGWGLNEAGTLRVLRRRMSSPKILRPLRVALVSDLHLGALTLASRVRRMVALVNAQKPDLVILAGDIVNDHPENLEPYAAMLRGMTPPLGVFGVFGNHERYAGDAKSARVFRWAGATLVRNRVVAVPGTGVQLLGVDDPGLAGDVTTRIGREILGVAAQSDPARFRILLNHRPLAWREAAQPAGIELMLSGHTHRGQVFPFSLVVRLFHRYLGGFYEENGHVLAVSAGVGCWGPPLRVLAPPDIMVLDLAPQKYAAEA